MDIHRARFIPYPSSAINALAFSASSDSELSKGGLKNLRLAVGRQNGDIEIWNPLKGAWTQERTFHAGKDRSIEGLQWTQEPNEYDGMKVSSAGQLRLFSIGYSSFVTEWDLGTGLTLRHSSGSLSEIWCFAAQPRLHPGEARKAAEEGKPQGQNIVVGCDDGSIALLSTDDNDLQFARYISRPQTKSVRALSIAFRDRDTVAVGFSNSSFRIFDIRNSALIRTVTLGAGQQGGPRDIHIWALKWLPNGDIVTGDSTGEVRFFDAKLYSQYQRIKAHAGEIFDVATSHDGSRVFTASNDRRTSTFTRDLRKLGKGRMWTRLGHKFYHDHDVKALAVYDASKTQAMSFLASGGLDTNLSIIPVQQYGEEYHRVISGLPQQPPVASSTSARLVASWHDQTITIWRIKSKKIKANNEKVHRTVAKILIKGEESIAAAALSPDGFMLAVTTLSKTKLFALIPIPDGPNDIIKVEKLQDQSDLSGGTAVQFSQDQKWLSIIRHTNEAIVYRLIDDFDGRFRIASQPFRLTRQRRGADTTSLQAYRRAIVRHQFSPDSKVLVVADVSGFVDAWSLEGEEDLSAPAVEMKDEDESSEDSSSEDEDDEPELKTLGQYWRSMESARTFPQLDSAPLMLTFRPGRKTESSLTNGVNGTHSTTDQDGSIRPNATYDLFILTSSHTLLEFSLTSGRLTDWSRRNPSDHLPETFRKIKDRAMGCYWHNKLVAQRLYMYGTNWMFMFDVSQDLEVEAKDEDEKTKALIDRPNKRKWQGKSGAGDAVRDEDYVGFKPGVETTQAGEKVAKKIKTEDKQKLIKSENDDEMEDDDEDEDEMPTTLSLRQQEVTKVNGAEEEVPRKTWHSFAYRPIFAVIPMEGTAEYIETVIVERPSWELLSSLPPRLLGPHEKPT